MVAPSDALAENRALRCAWGCPTDIARHYRIAMIEIRTTDPA
jgi:hypothetical protein